MTIRNVAILALVALAVWYLAWPPPSDKPCPGPGPCPAPQPAPKPKPKPKRPLRPWGDIKVVGSLPTLGGESWNGLEVMVDLPESEKKKNVGGRDGAGLCVFTSIEYCARWQNERRLFDFQKQMRQELGGGYPEKVDRMMKKYAPGVEYVQHTGGDINFLIQAMRTGRAAGVTYGGYDPHYRGYVAHMVTLVYLDENFAAISDNNFPRDEDIVWMSTPEFVKRWKMGSSGWAVVLLNPPPPPTPKAPR